MHEDYAGKDRQGKDDKDDDSGFVIGRGNWSAKLVLRMVHALMLYRRVSRVIARSLA